MIDDEVGKYRKKSTAKGQPRSKHKHIYETVLLITPYEVPDIHTGKQIKKEHRYPTKVCTICGRVADIDYDEKWYNKIEHKHLKWTYFTKELSEAALKLPVWYRNEHLINLLHFGRITMTNFDKIKNMSLEDFAEWIDEHGMFDNTPWMKWFNENYCDKCESIFVKASDAESVLGIKPFYDEEYECAYCEVYEDCCKFFPEGCPSNKEIIKMWLEETVDG